MDGSTFFVVLIPFGSRIFFIAMCYNEYKFWRVSENGDIIQLDVEHCSETVHTEHTMLDNSNILDDEFRLLSEYHYEDLVEFYFVYMEALRKSGKDRVEIFTKHKPYTSPQRIHKTDSATLCGDSEELLNSNKYSGRWITNNSGISFVDENGMNFLMYKIGKLLERNVVTEVFSNPSIEAMLKVEFYYIFLDTLRSNRIGSVSFNTLYLDEVLCCDKIRE